MKQINWRPVRGWEEKYEVNTEGHIRCKIVSRHKKAGAFVSQFCCDDGYRQVHFHRGGKRKRMFVHRVVAEAFLPINENPAYEVAHINGNPSDNRLENLMWCSHKENMEHKRGHGRWQEGEAIGTARLTSDDVRVIRELHKQGVSLSEIGRGFGVHYSTVSFVVNGKTWRHV